MPDVLTDQLHTFRYRKDGAFALVVGDSDRDMFEYPGRTGQHIEVTVGEGIKCPRIDCFFHEERGSPDWVPVSGCLSYLPGDTLWNPE
ncbi:MAG: hypothetical protein BWY82_02996 [Verrucomicrobia bacterium ADurb.Bin474]|nr:MAG: hypothetical protein BWY82_02996 [Verrucomicrobia bacterium ADurb.Bin474]